MIRVNAVVEGQTEETFVRESLARHLATCGVGIIARRVEFGRKKQRIHRGGLVDYAQLRKDTLNWLKQDSAAHVTTMVDLYALPGDFPGRADADKLADPYRKVAFLEEAFRNDIGSQRFVPYIQLHEFESLLFADIAKLSNYYPGCEKAIRALVAEASQFACPELIDDGSTTAPSKRILRAVPNYEKVTVGSLVTGDIGLPLIRSRSPHFDQWLARLEELG